MIISLLLLVYAPSLHNGFVFDDRGLTVENAAVMSPSWDVLISSYRPLRTVSYALDHRLFGPSPAAFRGMNIIYHLLVTVLVFFFVRLVSGGPVAPLIAAALFALHPVQTDAVAYISGRRDILVALFFLASLLAFLRYIRSGGVGYLLLAILAFVLSFLSKETGAMAPFLMMAILFLFGNGVSVTRKRLVAALFLSLLGIAVIMALRGGGSPLIYHGNIAFHGNSAATHYLTASTLPAYYLKQTLFPLQLIMDNAAYPLVTEFGAKFFFSLAVILLYLAIVGLLYVKKYIRTAFYMLFFLITLLPVLQIVPLHEIAADHYLYLPLVGFCGIAGEVGHRAVLWLKERRTVPAAAFLTLLCVTLPLYSAKTTARIGEMSTIYTVLLADHQWRPLSFRGLYTIGAFYMDAGFPDVAYRYYQASLATGYYDASLFGNILSYFIVKGDHAGAIRYFEEREKRGEAVSPIAFAHTAVIYAVQGDCDRASATMQRIPPGAFDRQRAFVAQCEESKKRDIAGRIDHLHSLGLMVESRPLYEQLFSGAILSMGEKEKRLRELVDILSRYDIPAAAHYLEMPDKDISAGARHVLTRARDRVRRFCEWSEISLGNGFCR